MGSKGRALVPLPPHSTALALPWENNPKESNQALPRSSVTRGFTCCSGIKYNSSPPSIVPLPTTNWRKGEMPMATLFIPQFKTCISSFPSRKVNSISYTAVLVWRFHSIIWVSPSCGHAPAPALARMNFTMCKSLGHHSPSSFTYSSNPGDSDLKTWSKVWALDNTLDTFIFQDTNYWPPTWFWNLQLGKPKSSSLSSMQPPHLPQTQLSFPLHHLMGSLPKLLIPAAAPSLPSQAGTKPLTRPLHLQSVTKPVIFYLYMACKSVKGSTPFPPHHHCRYIRKLLDNSSLSSPIPGSPHFPGHLMSLPAQISLTITSP